MHRIAMNGESVNQKILKFGIATYISLVSSNVQGSQYVYACYEKKRKQNSNSGFINHIGIWEI
jgi:hypothetical protein